METDLFDLVLVPHGVDEVFVFTLHAFLAGEAEVHDALVDGRVQEVLETDASFHRRPAIAAVL